MSARGRLALVGPPLLTSAITALTLVMIGGQAVGPDGASYFSIAEHWAAGDWSHAINGYWSPLISILLAPAFLLGVSPLVVWCLLTVASAAMATAALQRLMRAGRVEMPLVLVLSVGAAPFVVFVAVDTIGPDLLMAALLTWFVAEVLVDERAAWKVGALGGLAFLAKAYAAPFIVVFLLSLAVGRRVGLRPSRSRSHASLAGVAAAFGCVVALWSAAVTIDEGRLTFSTASAYNRSVTSPGSPGIPYAWAGLIEPDHPNAFWAWEDPAQLPTPQDRPALAADRIDSADAGPGRLERIAQNLNDAARASALAAGSVVVAVGAVAWALVSMLRRRGRGADDDDRVDIIVLIGLAAAIYVGGLLFVVVTVRYLSFVLILAVAAAALCLSCAGTRRPRHCRTLLLVAALVALGTAARPAVALYRLGQIADDGRFTELVFGDLAVDGQRVASFPADLVLVGASCFEAGCTYLGAPSLNPAAGTVPEQLRDFDVDVFVVRADSNIDLAVGAVIVHRSDVAGYVVYDLGATTGR